MRVLDMPRRWVASALWLIVLLILARTLFAIIEPESLASIADDSSNYLVMARCLSPWVVEGVAASICGEQYFPAVFPLMLGLLGAESALPLAHLIVVGAFLVSLPMIWLYANRVLGARAAAHGVVMCFVLLPGTTLGLQGILSESTYLLLSAAFLLLVPEAERPATPARSFAAGVVLGLLVSTRTVGVVLALAMLVRCLVSRLRGRDETAPTVITLGTAGVLAATLRGLFPPANTPNDYASLWGGFLSNLPEIPGYLTEQAGALTESWASFIALYWTDDRPLVWFGLSGVLAVCGVGLALRLWSNRLDAWCVALYLLVLIAWPFPGQMFRFLFPVMPFLLLQGVWLLLLLAGRFPRFRAATVFAPVFVLALALPAHAFLLGRAELARDMGINPVHEWMRNPDVDAATRELGLQNAIFDDLEASASALPPEAVVAFYEPSYVVLLAQRPSLHLPWPMDAGAWDSAMRAGATHAYLSRIHPRMSRSSIDGLRIRGSLPAGISLLWCSQEKFSGVVAGCMYALPHTDTP